jgi:hypothetical protein
MKNIEDMTLGSSDIYTRNDYLKMKQLGEYVQSYAEKSKDINGAAIKINSTKDNKYEEIVIQPNKSIDEGFNSTLDILEKNVKQIEVQTYTGLNITSHTNRGFLNKNAKYSQIRRIKIYKNNGKVKEFISFVDDDKRTKDKEKLKQYSSIRGLKLKDFPLVDEIRETKDGVIESLYKISGTKNGKKYDYVLVQDFSKLKNKNSEIAIGYIVDGEEMIIEGKSTMGEAKEEIEKNHKNISNKTQNENPEDKIDPRKWSEEI